MEEIKVDDKSILEIGNTFYTRLFSSQGISDEEINSYLTTITPEKCLSDACNRKNMCDGEITVGECKFSVTNMENNKSQGLDGIPIEFYKSFWDSIGSI